MVSLLETLLTILIFGVYIGWVDDIYHILMLKGSVLREQTGYLNLMFHIITGYLYSGLYRFAPGINWWGYFMTGYTFCIILLYNSLLIHLIRDFVNRKRRAFIFILFSLAFFGAVLAEQVFLLNSTRIALSLASAAFLAVMVLLKHHSNERYYKWFLGLGLLMCFLGWATRFNIVMLLFPVMVWFAFLYLKPQLALRTSIIGAVLAFVTIATAWAILSPSQKVAMRETMRVERQILSYLDGLNRNEIHYFKDQRDSIKARSFYNWYFADTDTLLDEAFLERLKLEPASGMDQIHQWQENFHRQLDRAATAYTKDYMPDWNWYQKTMLILGILLLMPYFFFYRESLRKYWYIWMVPYLLDAWFLHQWHPFIFYIWLLVIPLLLFRGSLNIHSYLFRTMAFAVAMAFFLGTLSAIIKMEDRFLAPCLLMWFFGQWLLAADLKKIDSRYMVYALIPIFIAITAWRVPQYQRMAEQRASDVAIKLKIREEIRERYPDKVVFFDLYTCTLLETSPFKDEKLPLNWIAGVETHNMAAWPHKKRIQDHVGCIDWPCFYDQVSKEPDKFIFCAMRERIEITEAYNRIIYDRPLKFKKESEGAYIDSLQYSFIWSPWDLGYYAIDTTSMPADTLNQAAKNLQEEENEAPGSTFRLH